MDNKCSLCCVICTCFPPETKLWRSASLRGIAEKSAVQSDCLARCHCLKSALLVRTVITVAFYVEHVAVTLSLSLYCYRSPSLSLSLYSCAALHQGWGRAYSRLQQMPILGLSCQCLRILFSMPRSVLAIHLICARHNCKLAIASIFASPVSSCGECPTSILNSQANHQRVSIPPLT